MPDDGNRGPVKTKSIPNVPTERLGAEQSRLHDLLHTTEGLRRHDGPRRELIDNGMKRKMIGHELMLRGSQTEDCIHCKPSGDTGVPS